MARSRDITLVARVYGHQRECLYMGVIRPRSRMTSQEQKKPTLMDEIAGYFDAYEQDGEMGTVEEHHMLEDVIESTVLAHEKADAEQRKEWISLLREIRANIKFGRNIMARAAAQVKITKVIAEMEAEP